MSEITIYHNPRCSKSRQTLVMASHPALIERPIVEAGGRAAIGRPPENVLQII